MNEIFNPTLVLSVGASGERALHELKAMVCQMPKYLTDVISLYDVNNLDTCRKQLQDIIDQKLLSARRINKLVERGYKIRMETTTNIRINIYVFWDMEDMKFPFSDIIDILFKLNYNNEGIGRHSGASLFILPIMPRKLKEDSENQNSGYKELQWVVDFLSLEENILAMDSKVYLTNTVVKDGLRIDRSELEYVLGKIVYLSIIPSSDPILSIYNKKLLKEEKDYKVGTIGISILRVPKENMINEFGNYLMVDLMTHSLEFQRDIDFKSYRSYNLLISKYLLNELNDQLPQGDNGERLLQIPEDLEIKAQREKMLWMDYGENYKAVLDEKEEELSQKYIQILKDQVYTRRNQLLEEEKAEILEELITIESKFSLREGKNFLIHVLDTINRERLLISNDSINKPCLAETYNHKNKKEEDIPNFLGFCSLSILIVVVFVCASIELWKDITFVNTTIKVICTSIIILSLIFMLLVYYSKKIGEYIENYIENIYIRQGKLLKSYLINEVYNYYNKLEEYIKGRIEYIDKAIVNCNNIKMKLVSSSREKEEVLEENALVSDLLTYEDRAIYYRRSKRDMESIYCRLTDKMFSIEDFKEPQLKGMIKEFSKEIAKEYVNKDFYEYVTFKWGDDSKVHLEKWLYRAIIESKELLQYDEDSRIEEHRLFISSDDLFQDNEEVIKKELNPFEITAIDSNYVTTDCIALVKVVLGIELNKLAPFRGK